MVNNASFPTEMSYNFLQTRTDLIEKIAPRMNDHSANLGFPTSDTISSLNYPDYNRRMRDAALSTNEHLFAY